MLQKLKSFWFAPLLPERLGLLRIILGCFSLWYILSRYRMMLKIAAGRKSLYEPMGLANLIESPLTLSHFQLLLFWTILLNILFIIGWKFKFTGPIFAIVFLLLMSYRNSWSNVYHNYNALVVHICILGFTPAADVLSLDIWMKKKNKWLENGQKHWHYGWPILLISSSTIIGYLLAGTAKIYGDLAWEWLSGNSMRLQVAVDAIRKDLLGKQASPLFLLIYPHKWMFTIMGIATILLELGSPLALFYKRIGITWSVLMCIMHWGILFIMGIHFPYHLGGFIFLSFFPIENLWFYFRGFISKLKRKKP